jgi:hypothetical protein
MYPVYQFTEHISKAYSKYLIACFKFSTDDKINIYSFLSNNLIKSINHRSHILLKDDTCTPILVFLSSRNILNAKIRFSDVKKCIKTIFQMLSCSFGNRSSGTPGWKHYIHPARHFSSPSHTFVISCTENSRTHLKENKTEEYSITIWCITTKCHLPVVLLLFR